MKNRLPKRLSAWLLTLVMLMGMLPAMASADEVDEDLSPPAPQEDYGYVRLVFSEGEQLDLYHGEYITECSPMAAVHAGRCEHRRGRGSSGSDYNTEDDTQPRGFMKASRHRRRRAIIQVALFCTTQHQRWDIPFQWAVPAKKQRHRTIHIYKRHELCCSL